MRAKRAYFIFAHYYKSVLLENMKRVVWLEQCPKRKATAFLKNKLVCLPRRKTMIFHKFRPKSNPSTPYCIWNMGLSQLSKNNECFPKYSKSSAEDNHPLKNPPTNPWPRLTTQSDGFAASSLRKCWNVSKDNSLSMIAAKMAPRQTGSHYSKSTKI